MTRRFVLAALVVLLTATSAHAATWYVKGSGPSTTPPADSCARADVQAAVNATSPGDLVILGDGGGSPCGPYTTPISTQSHPAIEIRGAGVMPSIGAATSGGTTYAVNSANDVFDIFESPSGNVTVSNITFTVANGASRPSAPGAVIYCGSRDNGPTPTLTDGICILHHITVTQVDLTIFDWASFQPLRGLAYRNIWQNTVNWSSGGLNNSSPKIACKGSGTYAPLNWAATSSFGMADTTGTRNLYIETNTIINTVNAVDIDDGCRAVLRYNTFQDAEPTDHGHDTSVTGERHAEVYNNTFSCVAATPWDFNAAAGWFSGRGGTWAITDNVAPHTCFGITRAPWSATLIPLRRLLYEVRSTTGTTTSSSTIITGLGSTTGVLAGQSVYGSNIPGSATVNSVDSASQVTISAAATGSGAVTVGFADCYPGPYPWLRQQGWGWAGSGDDTNQILEPAYIWNNKYTSGGTAGEADVFTAYDSPSVCAFDNSSQTSAGYIQQNREYYLSVAKPGYTKYTYPHPLAGGVTSYTITASAGSNGSISPSGVVVVSAGANQAFSLTPSTGYHVSDVLVDGASVGAVTSYTFIGVATNHTIAATFAINTYTITATFGAHGTLAPSVGIVVNYGGSQAFTITADASYHVADVLVDGVSVGAVTGYTFSNVTANHTISATFALNDYTITGTITLSGSPLANVSLAGAACTVTNALGQYSCGVSSGFSGAIAPSLMGYLFTPASRSYVTITSNQTSQNYTAATTPTSPTTTRSMKLKGGITIR